MNDERVSKLTSELNLLQTENNEKQAVNDKLSRELEDLVEHQQLLESKTKESIEQQNILREKTIEIDDEITDLNKKLGLVENDHVIQVEANKVQNSRLGMY